MNAPLYSIVIPCYKSAATIEKVVRSTEEELYKIGIDNYEFILVNDCSPDERQTFKAIAKLAQSDSHVKAVDLAKNTGQHNATMAGLNYASGDFIISMDDDMQTRPSEIIKLKNKLDEGFDVVYGYYEQKQESLFRRFGSYVNYQTVRLLIHKPKWLKTSSFWIMRKYVRDYAINYTYPNVHLQGVFLRITSNIASVPVQHFKRENGRSGYTLKKLLSLYSNIVGYSMLPLNSIRNIGFITALFGFILSVFFFIRKLINPSVSAGWTSLIAGICFFSGVILIAIGVVGGYIGRLYMGNTRLPQYTVRQTININSDKEC